MPHGQGSGHVAGQSEGQATRRYGLPWRGAQVAATAEAAGVTAFCSGEFVDHEAYSTLAEMALHTSRSLVGPGIAYAFARTPYRAQLRAVVTVSAVKMSAGTATVTGCAWGTTVCASWTVTAVDATQWRIAAGSGAAQSVSAGTALAPVTLAVTDTAGHALQGAAVSVYQTADGWEGVCPVPGRCPASPVLASAQSSGISDSSGNVSVTPLEAAMLPEPDSARVPVVIVVTPV